jgi:hypothetical protein
MLWERTGDEGSDEEREVYRTTTLSSLQLTLRSALSTGDPDNVRDNLHLLPSSASPQRRPNCDYACSRVQARFAILQRRQAMTDTM